MSAITFPAAESNPSGTRISIQERLDRFLGPVMFYLSLAALVLAAGVIHRLSHGDLSDFEAEALRWGVVLVWPVFVLEGLARLWWRRWPTVSPTHRVLCFAAVCLIPPLRLTGRAYADPAKILLPCWGWTTVDCQLRNRLERLISGPMIVVALLVLPFLAMEYFWLETVRAHFVLSLILDIGTAVIWLAFALEFIVMVSIADDKTTYCLHHWMDLAVVILPLIDFLPILRLLRLGSLLEVQQVSRLGRLYRLKGLLAKCWRAFLVLEIIQRLLGRRDNRLDRLKKSLAARQEEVAALEKEIAELEKRLIDETQTTAHEIAATSPDCRVPAAALAPIQKSDPVSSTGSLCESTSNPV